MQKQRVGTRGYKKAHGVMVLVTGQHLHLFFVLSPTGGRQWTLSRNMVSLKLGQGAKLFPGAIADHLLPLRVKIQDSLLDLTYLDPPLRLRILRTFPLARRAGFLVTIWV